MLMTIAFIFLSLLCPWKQSHKLPFFHLEVQSIFYLLVFSLLKQSSGERAVTVLVFRPLPVFESGGSRGPPLGAPTTPNTLRTQSEASRHQRPQDRVADRPSPRVTAENQRLPSPTLARVLTMLFTSNSL